MAQLVRAPPCHGGGRGFESLPGRLSWDLSSAGRASALQAEGHRFEPCRSHLFFADVAQLAEQLICNCLLYTSNAGGVPNTCKSNEAPATDSFGMKMLET